MRRECRHPVSTCDRELRVQLRSGIFPNPDVKAARLNHPPLRLRTPELEFVPAQGEAERPGLARLQCHAAKPFDLAHRKTSVAIARRRIASPSPSAWVGRGSKYRPRLGGSRRRVSYAVR